MIVLRQQGRMRRVELWRIHANRLSEFFVRIYRSAQTITRELRR